MLEPVLLSMGANLPSRVGVPRATISRAIDELADFGVEVMAVSRLYRTPGFPAGNRPDFVNAAVLCRTSLAADRVLHNLNKIERNFGRARTERWGPRTLDIDLLAVGDRVLPDRATYESWRALPPDAQQNKAPEEMILPHPRMQDRAFVLIPLADVAPDWCHPVLGLTVSEMLAALPQSEKSGIRAIDRA